MASETASPQVAQVQSPKQLDAALGDKADPSTPSTPTDARSLNDARSKTITVADGHDTHGAVNQHPAGEHASGLRVGVSEDRNRKCRRTMEDSHAFIYDYGGVRGQGFFAVFDGHAGKHAAEWCGANFHEVRSTDKSRVLTSQYLLAELRAKPDDPVPDLLNSTFHEVDSKLSQLAADEGTHSGCTAVTAFLRLETADGKPIGSHGGAGPPTERDAETGDAASEPPSSSEKISSGQKIRNLFKRHSTTTPPESKPTPPPSTDAEAQPTPVPSGSNVRRALYTANVGDARAVLSRGGKAVRLTYDHKGSDPQEVKRITDAGGFVLNQRVNGVLAVTRALGDASVKQFVSGSPYTTETTLGDDDTQLIIACDGLWDVCSDQQAVDLIKDVPDPQEASRKLLEHALGAFSTDNLSVIVVSLGAPSA